MTPPRAFKTRPWIGLFLGIVLVVAFAGVDSVPKAHAATPLSVDANVTASSGGYVNRFSSPAFSTTEADEVVLAFIGADGPDAFGEQSISSVSGAGLSWTLVERSNTQAGTAEIWEAVAAATLSDATIAVIPTLGGYRGWISVVSFAGADTSAIGAVAATSAGDGPPLVSLTTTRDGSWVWAAGHDWDRATGRTVADGQTLADQLIDSDTGDTYWSQYNTAVTPSSGTIVTLADTSPTTDRWNFAAVEILPASAPTPPNSTTTTSPATTTTTTSPATTTTTTSPATTTTTSTVTSTTLPSTTTTTTTTPTGNGNPIFADSFPGTTLSPAWSVISRHGEYAQQETECNIPQQVGVNGQLTITATAQPTSCGDFNIDGTARTAPAVWPYATGDIQWTNFNFTYGTVTYRAKFPPQSTSTWPAIWLLDSNCQNTNLYTADVNYSTCPGVQTAKYTEIDMTECYGGNWCQLAVSQPGSFPHCDYASPTDANWHTYSLNWQPGSITMSVDGVSTGCSYTSAEGYVIPSTPMFLIMQIQTGGVGGTPANLPASLQVSSVTVTQP